jgi:DnaK suppressor protein
MAKKKEVKKADKKAKPVTNKKSSGAKSVKKAAPVKKATVTKKKTTTTAKSKPKAVIATKKTMSKQVTSDKNKGKTKEKAKAVKPAGKKSETSKTEKKSSSKTSAKEVKKPVGKPIDAIAKKPKKAKGAKGTKTAGGAKETGEEEEDVEVTDDYEKADEEDEQVDASLDEAGMIDLEGGGGSDIIDDDDDEIPEKRGRGRRKKNEGKSSGSNMESYIRNRPLQIDINRPLIKKGNVGAPKPFINTQDNRSRYSDKELTEFKELILDKLKEAQGDYDLLKQTLSNEDNHGTDDTSPSFKLLEDGSDVMSKEETAQLASRQEKYIINLKNALVRIENKSYGICRVTGKLIPKERLRSVPHATLGIDAKLSQA